MDDDARALRMFLAALRLASSATRSLLLHHACGLYPEIRQEIVRDYERVRRALSRTKAPRRPDKSRRLSGQDPPICPDATPLTPPLTKTLATKSHITLDPKDVQFLESCPEPFREQWLADPTWWDGLRNGYDRIDLQEEANRYIAHQRSVGKNGHKNLRRGFRNWVAIAEARRQKQGIWDAQKAAR